MRSDIKTGRCDRVTMEASTPTCQFEGYTEVFILTIFYYLFIVQIFKKKGSHRITMSFLRIPLRNHSLGHKICEFY